GLAGGDLRGRGRYDLSGRERGYISLSLTGVDSRRLLSPLPKLASNISATMDGTLRGSLGHEFNGTGQLSFSRGHVFGLTVTDGRLPFDWAFSLGGSGEVKFHDLSAQGGNGRISGDTEYLWGLDNRLDGHRRFARPSLARRLSHSAPGARRPVAAALQRRQRHHRGPARSLRQRHDWTNWRQPRFGPPVGTAPAGRGADSRDHAGPRQQFAFQ